MSRSRRARRAHRAVRVVAWAALVVVACRDAPSAPNAARAESDAGQWRTWVLADGSALRPAAPPAPGSADEARELEAIVQRQAHRAVSDAALRRWSGHPTAPWDSVALGTLDFYFPLLPDVRLATPVRAARVMALLHVAAYDALVAAWDAKYAYRRTAPSATDRRVRALVPAGDVPSYPSEHAAVAEAAAAVLAYLFPAEDTLAFHALAREAGEARVEAGAAYPSDVDAGAAIGRAVAARVIARARVDGAAEPWTGAIPAGDGLWRPTPNKFVGVPFDAGAGGWRTWVLPNGAAFRPTPPPAPGSPGFARDVAELRALSVGRTAAQADVARYWATDAPSVIWEKFMLRELADRGIATVHAARAQAASSVAMYDAFVACWDAKFHYWVERPVTADSTLRTVFPTPPFPSYPSGHSTISTAAAEVFAELFPDAARTYRDKATDASLSRVYAAVHYRFDVEAGDTLGLAVGRAVVQRLKDDGAR